MTGKNLMILLAVIVIVALFYFSDVNPLQAIEVLVDGIAHLIDLGDSLILGAL